jgi:hypothetical protein
MKRIVFIKLAEFKFLEETESSTTFQYESSRKLYQFCEGLVIKLAVHTVQLMQVFQIGCEHQSGAKCVLQVNELVA